MSPDNLNLKELAHYGSQHSDPWVKQLADLVYQISYHMEYRTTIDEFFENNDQTISDLEYSVEEARSEEQEAYRERDAANNRYKAVRYDLDYLNHTKQVEAIQAQVVDVCEELKQSENYNRRLKQRIEEYKDEIKELKDKLNMWTILRTV